MAFSLSMRGTCVARSARRNTGKGADSTRAKAALFAGYLQVICRLLCLPTAPALPKVTNENFGTFSFQRQLSGKLLLARVYSCVVAGHNAQ
jgi:hypothetical protein